MFTSLLLRQSPHHSNSNRVLLTLLLFLLLPLLLLLHPVLSVSPPDLICTSKNNFQLCELPYDPAPHPFDFGQPIDRNLSRPNINHRRHIAPFAVRQSYAQFRATAIGQVTQSRVAAIDYCMRVASDSWRSPVSVNVQVNFSDLGRTLLLGSARPSRNWVVNDYICPVALAEAVIGEDLNSEQTGSLSYDILMTLNSESNWYEGIDARAPRGNYDLVTVCLHELYHGLFMTGGNIGVSRNPSDQSYSGIFLREGVAGRFDAFMSNQDGCQITAYTDNPQDLGTVLTGNNLWFAANATRLGRLHAPTPFVRGSSLYHLSEAVYGFSGDDNDLMTPAIGSNYGQHNTGDLVGRIQKLMLDIKSSTGAAQCANANAPEVDNTPISQQKPGATGDRSLSFECDGESFSISIAGNCVKGWIIVGGSIGTLVVIVAVVVTVAVLKSGQRKKLASRAAVARKEQREQGGMVDFNLGNAGGLV